MSPITGPLLTPMFATGSHPKVSNTQPHAAPVFDTGPHPEPLRPLDDAESGSESPSEPESVAESDPEPQPESVPVVESEPDPEPEPEPVPVLESHPEPEPQPEPVADASPSEAQLEAQPQPQPEPGPEPGPGPEPEAESQPEPEADGSEPDELQPFSQAFSELENVDTDSFLRTVHGHSHSHLGPVAVQAQPVLVPGSFLSVKRWQFALITAGVWVLAAAAGLGFYYWWYTSLDKTVPVFGILLYMAVCAVAAILVTMVPNRPQVTALAIALMAAPMASTAAAAVLHGAYYFEWIARPVMGPVIG